MRCYIRCGANWQRSSKLAAIDIIVETILSAYIRVSNGIHKLGPQLAMYPRYLDEKSTYNNTGSYSYSPLSFLATTRRTNHCKFELVCISFSQ